LSRGSLVATRRPDKFAHDRIDHAIVDERLKPLRDFFALRRSIYACPPSTKCPSARQRTMPPARFATSPKPAFCNSKAA
jgi:hypothetical protein